MRFLVLYAHPSDTSFVAEVHRAVVATLERAGHEVDDCDLYAEGFDPVLTRAEWSDYHTPAARDGGLAAHVDRLMAASGLVFVFPTWWYGMPAMLKGYIDRVWLPGTVFELVGGRTRSRLTHITHYAAVTTYGSPWWLNLYRNSGKAVLMRRMRHLVPRSARTLWLAQYGMDAIDAAKRRRFIARVERRLQSF